MFSFLSWFHNLAPQLSGVLKTLVKGQNSCLPFEFENHAVIPKTICALPRGAIMAELGELAWLFPVVLPGIDFMPQMNTEPDFSEMWLLLFMPLGTEA